MSQLDTAAKVLEHIRGICPKCGKQMHEQPKFPGLWICEDYRNAINDKPPFVYKCDGMHLTKEGADALEAELWNQLTQRN